MKYTFNRERPLSWSAISSFEYDKEQWFRRYVLGEKDEPTKEMLFGKKLADSIENGTCDVPTLLENLQKKKEHKFQVMFGPIALVGFADAFCEDTLRKLDEVKTGKKAWDQKRADSHRQFDMYLLMNYITSRIDPSEVECTLHWIPTQDNNDFSISFVEPIEVKRFKTKRTMTDILKFGERIQRVVREMEEYVEEKNRVSQ